MNYVLRINKFLAYAKKTPEEFLSVTRRTLRRLRRYSSNTSRSEMK
jgi:hypothetical protein